MKVLTTLLKYTFILVAVIVVGFIAAVYARKGRTFDAPYPEITASKDSAVIARGKYLVYGPAHCAECHAPMEKTIAVEKGELVPLSGGRDFDIPVGIIHAPNITPHEGTGIGKLTDAQIARAMRWGVKHDGTALLDFMPFYHLSDNDLTAIISYLRTTEPVANKRPEHEWNFLGNAVRAFMIKPSGDGKFDNAPAYDTTAEYGHYLAESVSNCRGCHTKRNMMNGDYIGPAYAGGHQIDVSGEDGKPIADQHLVTPNLTSDAETGRIAAWSQEQFVQRFRTGRLLPGSPMPWGPFSRMTDVEIIAIYKFLKTLPAVKNETPTGVQQGKPV